MKCSPDSVAIAPEHLLIFMKYPELGRVKTRLIPAIGAESATQLHRQMVEHTLTQARSLRNARDGRLLISVYVAGNYTLAALQAWLGADLHYYPQVSGDLGARMLQGLQVAFAAGAERVLVIGTDCPGLSVEIMTQALTQLDHPDLVLGPALDGGYYLLGLRSLQPALFESIAWGTELVLQATVQVAQQQNLSYSYLPALADVDRPEDLPVWSAIADQTQQPSPSSRLSIIVPVLNEADLIQVQVERLKRQTCAEIIVVDGGSTDRTVSLARSTGVQVLEAAGGRGAQMNCGAAAATGDILLFLHVDTILPDTFEADIQKVMASDGKKTSAMVKDRSTCIAGAFSLKIDGPQFGLRVIEWGVDLRSRWGQLPYGDQALFLRKDQFEKMGGYANLPIMEDFELVTRLQKLGRITILSSAVKTSARRWLKQGVLKTTLINQAMVLGYSWGISAEQLAHWYRSTRSKRS